MRTLFRTVVFFLLTGSANATIVTADADAFATGTDISNAFAGLTLSFEGTTSFGITDGIIYSADESGALLASTGTRVFGTADPTYPNLFTGASTSVFRIDFDTTMFTVSVDALADDISDLAQLTAYTAGDVVIDTYLTALMVSGASETMTVNGGNIAYVIAEGVSPDAVGFDNLVANTVPIPAAVWLFGSGLGLLGWFRRRQTA